jgi:S-adenosylmethionine/arginine decarboxylase-like enzyme
LYTCGTATVTDKAAEFLMRELGSKSHVQQDLVRNSIKEETVE